MKMRIRLAFAFVAIGFVSIGNAQDSIVFAGLPFTKVESNAEATTQYEMSDAQSQEYRVLIVKRGGKYYWASRDNRELMHFQSGVAHWFVSEASGYVKIVDTSLIPGNESSGGFVYIEHLTLLLDTI
ncbi:MAG: hypothetical protein O2907_07025, partial [Proteobacteria bacterium]|nr:hypothetical protein [Pseudomonadota bacterium]